MENNAAEQPQGAPAAHQQAPPAPRPEFPLFQERRSLQMLHSALCESEAKNVAKRAQRRVSQLVVNVWDMCAAKRTGYAARGGMDDPVKAKIIAFMGDADGGLAAELSASLSLTRLRVLRENYERERVAYLAGIIVAKCEAEAREGNHRANLKYRDAQNELRAKLLVVGKVDNLFPRDTDAWKKRNNWEWLFTFLPSLRPTLESGGLAVSTLPLPTSGDNGNERESEVKNAGELGLLSISWSMESIPYELNSLSQLLPLTRGAHIS